MKILSSDAVIEAAEKAGRLILDTYLSPEQDIRRSARTDQRDGSFARFQRGLPPRIAIGRPALRLLTMPLLQYFGWVGSFLVAALLAANWWFSMQHRLRRFRRPLNEDQYPDPYGS